MTATREMTFLLAEPERRALRWIAAQLPAWLRPNHLTALGVVAAVGAGTGYALARIDPRWLWLASAMLALNWVGDSLDGTLARVRRIERPRYGYYLDHVADAFNTTVVGIGIGLSPFVPLELALLLVILYLTLSINVYLESAVLGVFKMAYGPLGPTEMRLLLILGNTVVVAAPAVRHAALLPLAVEAMLACAALGMLAVLAVRFSANLRRLARLEPRATSAASRLALPGS